jgi:2-iminobutanoate/2-iminopropanoate deaminase
MNLVNVGCPATLHTERLFQNLSAVLKAAGKNFDDVVCARVFPHEHQRLRRDEWDLRKAFQPAVSRPPTIGVAALPLGARVEIDLVAKA